MPVLTDSELFKQLKAKTLEPIYFFFGAESYFSSEALKKLEKLAVAPGFESFNLQKFQGAKSSVSEIEDACDALPVMAERKCVEVLDLDVEKLPKEELDRLLKLAAAPNDTTVLVLCMTAVPVELKKSAKYKKLADAVSKRGVVCEFGFKDKLTLKRALMDRARKAGAELDPDAAGALIERCPPDYASLLNELDKLVSFADGAKITPAHVDECCIRSIDASAFDLAKCILSGNFDRAFHLLDELFYLRQEAVMILGALAMAFADIYRAKCGISAKKTVDEVAKEFRYPKNRMFAVRNAYRDVLSFSESHIRACLNALYRADRKLKSSRTDDRLILEQMLGQMQASARRAI